MSVGLRPEPAYTTYPAYATAFIGLVVLAVSGWLGGSLVYDHHVGVPEAHDAGRATRDAGG
jgi:uncharacterized membrane protein